MDCLENEAELLESTRMPYFHILKLFHHRASYQPAFVVIAMWLGTFIERENRAITI
jgi:hypothetical protein